MSTPVVYVLGGYQSDFARHWTREGRSLFDLFAETLREGLAVTGLEPEQLEVGHVGNFVADLFTGQAHLGGFFGHVDPALTNLPASRHEAACASGSMALLSAMAELEAGRHGLACVLGIELMRNVPGAEGARNLGAAAWVGQEFTETDFVWPCAFNQLLEEYDQRYGIDEAHLSAISALNFRNAKANPKAQTRRWTLDESKFARDDDENNAPVAGRIRRHDCGQITDGAAVVFLANEDKAKAYAEAQGCSLADLPRIKGWAHVNAPLRYDTKVELSRGQPHVFPHIRQLFEDCLRRAQMTSVEDVSGLEVHDCFNITEVHDPRPHGCSPARSGVEGHREWGHHQGR